jgi:hypothetical protein
LDDREEVLEAARVGQGSSSSHEHDGAVLIPSDHAEDFSACVGCAFGECRE